MASYYELPGGLSWVKQNLRTIIGNRPLEEIMHFGDAWRDRGHTPLVHVISPAMDNGNMWDNHADPSGLLDNISVHIDLFIVDFYNRNEPELPRIWKQTARGPQQWLLWEYKAGCVRFNGDHNQCERKFGIDPAIVNPAPAPIPQPTPVPGDLGTDVTIHMVCPHCGQKIY